MEREKQIIRVNRLRDALGEGFDVRYDICESGTTEIYYDGHMVWRMLNSELLGEISITEIRRSALKAIGKSLFL